MLEFQPIDHRERAEFLIQCERSEPFGMKPDSSMFIAAHVIILSESVHATDHDVVVHDAAATCTTRPSGSGKYTRSPRRSGSSPAALSLSTAVAAVYSFTL
jgi:hypothetical protein